MDEGLTLQELIRRRQARGFVGRVEELSRFEVSLGLPVDDPRRQFLFSLHGDAGVGKTFLVRQFVRLAGERGYLTAYADETALDVPSTLAMLAADLQRHGERCKGFAERLEAYQRRRSELDADPGAPDGLPLLLTRSAVRVGLRAAGEVPLVGAVVEELDPDAVAGQVDRLRVYLNRKFRSQDDVRLMLSPAEVLTRAFLEDLSAAARLRPAALFLDTYEKTGGFLDPWLLGVLAGRFGPVPASLVLTIAGQLPLDTNRWGDYLDLRADLPLQAFTDTEARQLLTTRGMTDERVVDVILALSGRLPLLVAMLAEARPASPEAVGDPSGSAVERFLKWEPTAARRAAALHGAYPRRLDQDTLAAATGSGSPAEDFEWLRRLPFVVEHADGLRYHDIVRTQMLRVSRRRTPLDWQQRHTRLADHLTSQRDALGLSGRAGWKDERWQSLAVEEHYHRICATGPAALPAALNGLVDALAWRRQDLRRWTQMIQQAGHDTDAPDMRQHGTRLDALAGDDPDNQIRLADTLLADTALDDIHRATTYGERADAYLSQAKYDQALADSNQAVHLHPDAPWLLAGRGETYRLLEGYEEALTDFTRTIELDPEYAWAITSRGQTYRLLQRYEEALTDLNRAIELNPEYAWAIADRGETYRLLQRYEEALADFNRAIELDPEYDWAIASRGQTYQAMERHEEALTDLTRAIELNPEYDWAIAGRGRSYLALERYEEALADFTRAIELDPEYAWAIASRGQTYQVLERYEEALADFTQAIELNPAADWAIANRGETYRLLERYEDALTDLTRAIELNPEFGWAIASRGQTYQVLERYEEALTDFTRAIELDPEYAGAIASRGITYLAMERYGEALADFTRAIELDLTTDWVVANRGETYRLLERYEEALTDFNRAIELDPEYDWAIASRGQTYRALERHEDALADFTQAIELNPTADWVIANRGETYRLMEWYEEALADFNQAIEFNPEYDWAIASRGQTYRALERYEDALTDFNRAIELDPMDAWSRYETALVLHLTGLASASREQLEQALEVERQNIASQPGDREANSFNIVVYLAALGAFDDAEREIQGVLARRPTRGQITELIGDLRELQEVMHRDVRRLLHILQTQIGADQSLPTT